MEAEVGTRALGEYVSLQRGTTYKGALLGQPGPVLLGLATIQRNGGFRDDSLKTYGGDSPAKLLVQPGELYVSLKDVTQSADLLGAVAMLPRSQAAGRLTQDTVKLEPKNSEVPLGYLYWVLRTPQYREYCRAHATGTTNLGLPREDFLSFPIPPLTPERERLTSLLAALEDKIELNHRMNESLEEMARALFKSWFVDFDPVRAKAEGRDTGLPKHLADLFPGRFVDSELGEIPEGWNVGSLASVADLNPESWRAETMPPSVDYADLSGTKWGEISEITTYASVDAPSRARRVLRSGDTIVGTVRPGNGAYALVANDGLTGSTGFAVLRPVVSADFALCYLAATSRDSIETLAHLADGGAYPAVRPDVVHGLPLAVAPRNVRDAFQNVAGPMLRRSAQCRGDSDLSRAARDLLIADLLGSASVRGEPLGAPKIVGE